MSKNQTKEIISANPIQADFQPELSDIKHVSEFIEFARWCATTSLTREPATQKEFAKRFGVSEDSLGDWKQHPKFWAIVWSIILERMKEQIPDVIEGLYEKIASGKGSAGDVQLFLRLAGGNPSISDTKTK